jgi:hypothetical protein
MESPMHRWQPLVTDLQASCLADPGEGALHDPTDLAQAATVRCPLLRQMVFDPSLFEALMISRRAILAVPIQGLRPSPRAAAPPTDRRDLVHEVHRLERFVAVGSRDAHGQRGALAIDEQVPFGALLGPIRGVLAGQRPPKTARKLWLSTQQWSQSMPFSCPTRWRRACRSFFQTPRRCQ